MNFSLRLIGQFKSRCWYYGESLHGIGEIALYLSAGESFGGRSFAERARLATKPGEVTAEWLNG
jgi:hypothetical protein